MLELVYYSKVPSYSTFLQSNLQSNIPCVFGPELVASWPAIRAWDDNGLPNWGVIRAKFGSDEVSVANCDAIEFGDQCRNVMNVSEIMSIWLGKDRQVRGDGLYLKDWHLQLRHPQYEFYHTPEVFRDDWMNDYYINLREESDDFRFVYMGVKGTFTPLHRDVYCSYSWSTNVIGSKRWTLFPPPVSKHLYRADGKGSENERVFDVREYDQARYPNVESALEQAIVVIQKPQETIFVPSGWYHQVENLTDCISINHNWANCNSLKNMYQAMCDEIKEVEEALLDVRQMIQDRWSALEEDADGWQQEWVSVVQDVLGKNAGWGWLEFWKMVLHAVNTRCKLEGHADLDSDFASWQPPPTMLRPRWKDEHAIISEVLSRFREERTDDPRITDLAEVLEELIAALKQHAP